MTENNRKVWFISDLHFSHKNLLNFQLKRREIVGVNGDENLEDRLKKHDDYIINLWNKTVDKKDTIYILGDFSFADTLCTRKILEKLNGNKHLIIGNHDKSCKGLENYFVSVSQIKEVTFKKEEFPFLDETIHTILCHYPMVAWNRRLYGSLMIHGHTHGSIDQMNIDSGELRVDVGLDGKLSDYSIIDLEKLFNYFKDIRDKSGCKTFKEYIEKKSEKDGIRY